MSLEYSPARNRRSKQHDPLQLIRARDLADLFRVHIITIWRWADEGKLPKPIRLTGGVTAWRRSDIERWIDERAKKA